MRSVAAAAVECLLAANPDEKVRRTLRAADAWRAGGLALPSDDDAAPPARPSRPERPRLVAPQAVPRRRLTTANGRAALVHALAHIEHNAIGLAWDCVARFRALPRAFYDDWVAVAADEARHFAALRARLREMEHDYGDFDAHDGLWEMAAKTAHDLIARMALVPRVLEARALDVTPGMIERLRAARDDRTAAILEMILEEEVAHVAAGSRWFRFACAERGLDPVSTFRETVTRYWSGRIPAPTNFAHRRRAGFDDAEMAGWGAPVGDAARAK